MRGRRSAAPQPPSDWMQLVAWRVGSSLRPVGIAPTTARKGAPIDTASSSLDARPATIVNVRVPSARIGVRFTALGRVVLVHASASGKNCATIRSV